MLLKFSLENGKIARYPLGISPNAIFQPIWQRRFMFLAVYDVKKYCDSPTAPRGTDFTIPQLEFCCSPKCFKNFSEKDGMPEEEEPEPMQVEPAE